MKTVFGAWKAMRHIKIARSFLVAALVLLSAATAHAQTNAATTNGSVTITTGATFQTVLTAVASGSIRRSLTIQNNNATSSCLSSNNCDVCYVFIGASSATKGHSIELSATQAYTRFYPYVPSDAIQATCDSTNDTLYVDTQ